MLALLVVCGRALACCRTKGSGVGIVTRPMFLLQRRRALALRWLLRGGGAWWWRGYGWRIVVNLVVERAAALVVVGLCRKGKVLAQCCLP